MFKVRTVSLGRILTFSTAVLYLGYLWYKRKRALSHRQSDKKRPSSESSELIKIDDQELLQALEKASRTLEVSQVVEEEPVEISVIQEEIMEPTINQVEILNVESFINNSGVEEINKQITTTISNEEEQQVCIIDSNIINTIESLSYELKNLKLSVNEKEEIKVVEDSNNVLQIKDNTNEIIEDKFTIEKVNWTDMVENENHCECPKAINVKKIKKEDEPMLFEGIKFKSKKKRNRKNKQIQDTVKFPSESQNMNKENSIVKSSFKNKNHVIEEDCDSAHSVDHSIDTNDAPNTIYSDIRSEGSQDSGKGGSSFSGELRTISDSDEHSNYDFLVPMDLVGAIIGKRGAFVKYIKEKSNVRLFIENKTDSTHDKFKMCTLVGSEININRALKLIRTKFPERAYPEFTLECITPLLEGSPVISQLFKSELIEGVNNHVIITDLVSTDHFFVHNASSPDYALLSSLNFAMNDTYNNKEDIPEVDLRTVTHGSVVATFSEDNWYRAQVIDVDEKKYESANVFFLDYGGCKQIEQCDMRPMHDSLISLSFQAIECNLANIAPIYGEWSEESLKMFEALTTGKMLFAQVIYKSDNVQFINLLAFDGLVTLSVNDELIKYGFAVYTSPSGYYQNEIVQEIEN